MWSKRCILWCDSTILLRFSSDSKLISYLKDNNIPHEIKFIKGQNFLFFNDKKYYITEDGFTTMPYMLINYEEESQNVE